MLSGNVKYQDINDKVQVNKLLLSLRQKLVKGEEDNNDVNVGKVKQDKEDKQEKP